MASDNLTFSPLERLQILLPMKPISAGKWHTECPLCEGTLRIEETESGRVLLDCWNSCQPAKIAQAVGTTLAALLPPGVEDIAEFVPPLVEPMGLARPDPYAKQWTLTEAPAIPVRPFVVECCADVEAEPIYWLWPGHIPRGKVCLLAGVAGTGKSTLAMVIAAIVTNGGTWPDGTACEYPGDVLVWSSEDDRHDTLKPRLMAAGADQSRIHFLGGVDENGKPAPFDPSSDFPQLCAWLESVERPRLLILDPILNVVTGDMNKANEVRRAFQQVVDFAGQYGCAVMGIHHFTKNSHNSSPLDRIMGSQAIAAFARVALVVVKEDDGPTCCLMRAKSNIGPTDGGINYTLQPTVVKTTNHELSTVRIEWGAMVDGASWDIMDSMRRQPDSETVSRGQDAEDFLISALANGARNVEEIIKKGESLGHKRATIYRAKLKLKVECPRRGVWQLGKADRTL